MVQSADARGRIMKRGLVYAVWLVAIIARAAGDDIAGALQKGLFEEEANHNLAEAIQAYQSVVAQIDKDRKLAATAIFRLGECYRKQGKTNEASAYYERILRDFTDQSNLTALSRQSLAAMGEPQKATAPAKGERQALVAELDQLKALPRDRLRVVIQQRYPNPVLTSLMQQLLQAEQDRKSYEVDKGPNHPDVQKAHVLAEIVSKQIDEQVEVVLSNLEAQAQGMETGVKTHPATTFSAQTEASGDAGSSVDNEVRR